MHDLPQLYKILAMLSGVFWTAVYIMIIRRGFIDKSYGMPIAALALNISWELIYSFITPAPAPQRYINMIWFIFDVVIIYQVFKYWKEDYGTLFTKKNFYAFYGLLLATAFFAVLFIQYDALLVMKPKPYPLGMGRAYSAFGMNLIMSILFILFILRRGSLSGQSIYIALAKWIGTIFADIPFILYPAMPGTPGAGELLFPYFYISIFIFDLIYVIIVYKKSKEAGINPWKRI